MSTYVKQSSAIILACLILLIGCSSKEQGGKDIYSDLNKLKQEIKELNDKKASLEKEILGSKYVSFQVFGRILDRSENTVQILGRAMPSNGDWNNLGAVGDDRTLVITKIQGIQDPSNYSNNRVYFVEKNYQKNAFGMSIPVWFYTTDPPSEIKKLEKEINDIQTKISDIERKRAALKEQYFNRQKDNIPNLFQFAQYCISDNDSQRALLAYNRIIEADPHNVNALTLLGELYLKSGDSQHAMEKCRSAVGIDNKSAPAHKCLGLALLSNKDNFLAAKEFMDFLSLSTPNAPDSSQIMSELEQLKKNWGAEAIKMRTDIITIFDKITPKNWGLLSAHRFDSVQVQAIEKDFDNLKVNLNNININIYNLMKNDQSYQNELQKVYNSISAKIADAEKRIRRNYFGRGDYLREVKEYIAKAQSRLEQVQHYAQEIGVSVDKISSSSIPESSKRELSPREKSMWLGKIRNAKRQVEHLEKDHARMKEDLKFDSPKILEASKKRVMEHEEKVKNAKEDYEELLKAAREAGLSLSETQ